jgi:hypothetical protein
VLQEAIDVAVMVNALRALGAGRTQPRRPPPASVALGRRFRSEHRELLGVVDHVRAVADGLDRLPPPLALAEVAAVHRFLTERLLPHEEAEDALLYPMVAELLGGDDPTAPMSRAHAEIAHLSRLLGGVLADLGPAGPEAEDRTELRRILYGVHAILRLHFAQEERHTCRCSTTAGRNARPRVEVPPGRSRCRERSPGRGWTPGVPRPPDA